MTGRYVRSTFVEDQKAFVEHLQIGKQIGKLLDMPKRPQAQKHILWVWNLKNLETWFQSLKSLKNSTFPVTVMVLLKMGPRAPGALGPTPFRLCRRALQGFFREKRSQHKQCVFIKQMTCVCRFLLFLANVDLNLRLQINKIAI